MDKLSISYVGPVERSISPPMRDAVTIILKDSPVVIYVCRSAFVENGTRKDVLNVVKALEAAHAQV